MVYMQFVFGVLILNLFFGMLYSFGDVGMSGFGMFEDVLYGIVYVWMGDFNFVFLGKFYDDMGNFVVVVWDLIFYGYYVNVDRVWMIWKMFFGKQCMDFMYFDFFNLQYIFYDENGDVVVVNVF